MIDLIQIAWLTVMGIFVALQVKEMKAAKKRIASLETVVTQGDLSQLDLINTLTGRMEAAKSELEKAQKALPGKTAGANSCGSSSCGGRRAASCKAGLCGICCSTHCRCLFFLGAD